jgi:hypothetical protein
MKGYDMSSLYCLNNCRSRRESSYDRSGGNHDWIDIPAGETKTLFNVDACGIIRHIWMTCWVGGTSEKDEAHYLRKLTLRMFWDGETEPSVEAPLGDFFGVAFGLRRTYQSAAFAMNPEDGRGMNCFFPMPFEKNAKIILQNECEHSCNFYYYIDYEEHEQLPGEDIGRFHAMFRQERNTCGWAPNEPGLLDREKANEPGEPAWLPKAWMRKNTDGKDNYLVLEAEGKGKFVGCNIGIDVFERQANDWYGEGDDMFFIDGETWPPSLHGTGTEDYFSTAFCPTQEYCAPYSGLTRYSGEEAGFRFGGKNTMYRLHILDPIHFSKSILFSIEHGHANKLSNDYCSTAYWYQSEPHKPFSPFPGLEDRLPR